MRGLSGAPVHLQICQTHCIAIFSVVIRRVLELSHATEAQNGTPLVSASWNISPMIETAILEQAGEADMKTKLISENIVSARCDSISKLRLEKMVS